MRLSPRCKGIISGTDRDILAVLFRWLLWLPALTYSWIMRLRNRLYDWRRLAVTSLPAKVICVGNITVGGTGKTPMVVWLCELLQKRGLRPAILTRGYKSTSPGENDEVRLLRQRLPNVPIVVDSDRVRGGRKAIKDHQADVLVLDDGFQHRRLRRDLDIVLLDCTCPFGYEATLPRGLLREPLNSLDRAGAIVLTRVDQADQESITQVRQRLAQLTADPKPVWLSEHRPVNLNQANGGELPLEFLANKKILAVCGIGNPQGFITTLRQLDADVVEALCYDDHHAYTSNDIAVWHNKKNAQNIDAVVTTEKDWVKLHQFEKLDDLLWLRIELALKTDQAKIEALLDEVFTGAKNE
ncbi:MAG: tetraacyldisaccharide 4'-kinase [Sedimentisphaerales bacterium]|nr:tetraacyldisaccharide 4'-kinase [Sedimentisphaerales bacterium]